MRARGRQLACAALVTAALVYAGSAAPAARDDARHLELSSLVSQMEQLHPNLFHDMTREEWRGAVDALDTRLDSLSRDQLLVEFMRLVARVSAKGRDGHTAAYPTPATWPAVLGVRLYLFSDGLFVTGGLGANAGLVGSRVSAVGGHPVEEVLRGVEPLAPRDSAATVPLWLPLYVTMPNVLAGLGLVDADAPTTFTVIDRSGRERDVVVEKVPFSRWLSWTGGLFGLPGRKTLWLSRLGDDFWARHIPASKTLFVQYNQVAGPSSSEVADLRRLALRKMPVRVVVDLRNNGGGNNTRYYSFLSELARKPFNRPGRLFVFIGRMTFSAAGNFATEVDRRTKARFVGEPMGGGINQYGDAQSITLARLPIPLTVDVSTKYEEIARDDSRLTITPEIPAPLRSADFFGGRDPALRAAIAASRVRADRTLAAASTSVRSKHGLFHVTVTPAPARSPVGQIHSWRLMLRNAKGAAVKGARISVDGDMPEHGHGLPTQPRVREVGGGRYVVQGMKFQMGGFWYVKFTIRSHGRTDVARVEFTLPEH